MDRVNEGESYEDWRALVDASHCSAASARTAFIPPSRAAASSRRRFTRSAGSLHDTAMSLSAGAGGFGAVLSLGSAEP